MQRSSYLFTSESVSEGHPDKVCDRISDEVVDAFFRLGPQHGWNPRDLRVACETLATTNRVVIAGETRGPQQINSELLINTAREAIRDIGYEQDGFHWQRARIEVLLHAQSPNIAQGIMFGYACRETDALMPAPIQYSHAILKLMAEARKSGREQRLGPDAKSQVTVLYDHGKPVEVPQIVVSTQHLDPTLESKHVRDIVEPYVRRALPDGLITDRTVWHVNPTGAFVVGGPDGDCGLTGRKIIVDTYGGAAPHGGGAFSGKDPTKVDRSAAYAARYLAKNVVAAGIAERCTIQIAYAIGVSDPLSLYVDLHDSGQVSPVKLEKLLPELMSLKPRGIREHLSLNKPVYARTSAYGHFGRLPDSAGGFTWEKTDLVDELRRAF
jgi:S-adenosylmethionine synthetase